MSKVKVLQIGKYYYPYRGGFESSIYMLVNELKGKLQFYALAANIKSRTVREEVAGVTVVRLANFGRIFSQPIIPAIFIWLKKLKADIIHLHLPHPLAMIAYIIVSPPGKLVISYHNDMARLKTAMVFLRPLLMKLLCRADFIVVTSQNLIDNSAVLRGFRGKCRIIPHGIDINRFRATPEIIEKSEKVRSDFNKPIILFVGRLVYYKGLNYLIKAIREVDAKLVIIGLGPWQFKLKLLAKIFKVDKKISWLGDVSDERLPVYYHASDLFILPSCSKSESFGLVMLEAQASGKPVVSTDLPTGVTFVNLHKKTGLVVQPRNSFALAQAIDLLLKSKALREEYGRNGKERVEKEFSKEKMAGEMLKLYEAMM